MYVRTISRHNKDGSTTTSIQLAHHVRDPKTGLARANVRHPFGRADTLDIEAIRRLVKSLCRVLSPEDARKAQLSLGTETQGLHFMGSVPMGGAYLLRHLWRRLGLDKVLTHALAVNGHLKVYQFWS